MSVTLTPRPAYRLTDVEIDWRRSRLSKLGAGEELAQMVAESDVDVHTIEQLIGMGCPLDCAWRIVRPLEDPEPKPDSDVVERVAAYTEPRR